MNDCTLYDEYQKQEWLDEILSVDENGDIEYERDENGELVQLTDHFGRPLFNKYTGDPIPKPVFLQEGTRITAERMNYIEEHLCSLYGWKNIHESALEYIMIVLELEGSISGGQGTFFDAISELTPKGIEVDDFSAELTSATKAGATVLPVDNVGSLKVGDELNIYDDKNFESTKVQSVGDSSITVTTLTNAYQAGTYVKRSTVTTDRKNKQYKAVPFTVYDVTSRVV